MTRAILDTNLFVGWSNRGLHEELFLGRDLVRFLSAVVLMELRVGAATPSARRVLAQLVRAYDASDRIVLPPARRYESAGATLARLKARGLEVRRASLVNDVLIALTARGIGATLFTADGSDFEAIREVSSFDLQVVPS